MLVTHQQQAADLADTRIVMRAGALNSVTHASRDSYQSLDAQSSTAQVRRLPSAVGHCQCSPWAGWAVWIQGASCTEAACLLLTAADAVCERRLQTCKDVQPGTAGLLQPMVAAPRARVGALSRRAMIWAMHAVCRMVQKLQPCQILIAGEPPPLGSSELHTSCPGSRALMRLLAAFPPAL